MCSGLSARKSCENLSLSHFAGKVLQYSSDCDSVPSWKACPPTLRFDPAEQSLRAHPRRPQIASRRSFATKRRSG